MLENRKRVKDAFVGAGFTRLPVGQVPAHSKLSGSLNGWRSCCLRLTSGNSGNSLRVD